MTYTFLHIHTHPYAFRYIVVFLVHAFVQWHHMICFSILQNDCGPMDCISSCISCNELTRDKHVYWFKSAAHWIAYLYNSLVNQKHIVGIYVSSREVAATTAPVLNHEPWNQTEFECHVARLWSSVDVLSCGPLGSNSLILFFFQIKIVQPKV